MIDEDLLHAALARVLHGSFGTAHVEDEREEVHAIATEYDRLSDKSAARSAVPSDDIPSADARFVRESGGDDRIRTDE